MKIDKLIGRSASKIKDTDYLFKVPNDPTKVTGIGELMIADLLTRKSQQGDLTFYDQVSVKKLIDRQFLVTKVLIKA